APRFGRIALLRNAAASAHGQCATAVATLVDRPVLEPTIHHAAGSLGHHTPRSLLVAILRETRLVRCGVLLGATPTADRPSVVRTTLPVSISLLWSGGERRHRAGIARGARTLACARGGRGRRGSSARGFIPRKAAGEGERHATPALLRVHERRTAPPPPNWCAR